MAHVAPINVSSTSQGDNSWMSKVAEALAKAMTKLMDRMYNDAKDMASDDKHTASEAKADFQVASQQYTMVVTAISTVLKTLGEANTSLARKQ